MTLLEKRALAALGVALIGAAYLVAAFTEGLAIVDQESRHLWRAWLMLLLIGAAGGAVIAAWTARLRRAGAIEDERDAEIARRADRIGLVAGVVAVNALVWQALWQASLESAPRTRDFVAAPDLTHLPTLIFALLATLVIAEIVKQGATLMLSRL